MLKKNKKCSTGIVKEIMISCSNWINAHQNGIACIVVVAVIFSVCIVKKYREIIALCEISIYTIGVLYKTVFSRKSGSNAVILKIGWSYSALFNGVPGMFSQIYLNIMLFIPIGVFGTILFWNKKKSRYVIPVALGVMLTIIIECFQFVLKCGTFELDDIFNNTIGTILGILIVNVIYGIRNR